MSDSSTLLLGAHLIGGPMSTTFVVTTSRLLLSSGRAAHRDGPQVRQIGGVSHAPFGFCPLSQIIPAAPNVRRSPAPASQCAVMHNHAPRAPGHRLPVHAEPAFGTPATMTTALRSLTKSDSSDLQPSRGEPHLTEVGIRCLSQASTLLTCTCPRTAFGRPPAGTRCN